MPAVPNHLVPDPLATRMARALADARKAGDGTSRTVESDWPIDREHLVRVDVIQPATASRSALVGCAPFAIERGGMLMVYVPPVYGSPAVRICPTVLEHELRRHLAAGARHFRVVYHGTRRSSLRGGEYHAFTVAPLDLPPAGPGSDSDSESR